MVNEDRPCQVCPALNVEQRTRAECEEMELRSGVSQEGGEEEGGQMNGDPGEINR